MPKDFYTFLIIPKRKSSAKKLTISSSVLKGISIFGMLIIFISMYIYYDYMTIQREKGELAHLRQQTAEQRTKIEALAEKVNRYAATMDEFRKFDKQIRVLASIDNKVNKAQIQGIGGSVSVERRMISRMEDDQKTLIASINKNIDHLAEDAINQRQSYHELLSFLQ
jgi:hypothetical protein